MRHEESNSEASVSHACNTPPWLMESLAEEDMPSVASNVALGSQNLQIGFFLACLATMHWRCNTLSPDASALKHSLRLNFKVMTPEEAPHLPSSSASLRPSPATVRMRSVYATFQLARQVFAGLRFNCLAPAVLITDFKPMVQLVVGYSRRPSPATQAIANSLNFQAPKYSPFP